MVQAVPKQSKFQLKCPFNKSGNRLEIQDPTSDIFFQMSKIISNVQGVH